MYCLLEMDLGVIASIFDNLNISPTWATTHKPSGTETTEDVEYSA